MNLVTVAVKNVRRNSFRNALTVTGVAVAMLAFVLLRTVLSAWTIGAEYGAKDRVATRHKVSFVMSLPKRYVTDVQQVQGIKVLARAQQSMVWLRTRQTNRLRSALRDFYPAALAAFEDLHDRDALAVLSRAPDPDTAARLTRTQVTGRPQGRWQATQPRRDGRADPRRAAHRAVARTRRGQGGVRSSGHRPGRGHHRDQHPARAARGAAGTQC